MPTLDWIGKDKVLNHHQEVPFRTLERSYSFDENGQHKEDNHSENMIIHGDKQSIFTEKKIYPYLKKEELRLDLLPRIRQMAGNHAMSVHPWMEMDDDTLLRSAGLYGIDHVIGESGYNLAAIMLLGRDEVIQDVVPAYVTDALVRKVNVDRIEGDIFRIIVPLDDGYSFDQNIGSETTQMTTQMTTDKLPVKLTDTEEGI